MSTEVLDSSVPDEINKYDFRTESTAIFKARTDRNVLGEAGLAILVVQADHNVRAGVDAGPASGCVKVHLQLRSHRTIRADLPQDPTDEHRPTSNIAPRGGRVL